MRIVVLDDLGIGAGDLRRLEAAGEIRIFSAAPSGDAEIVKRLQGADVVISGWTRIGRDVLHVAADVAIANARVREKATILMVTDGLPDADVALLGYRRMPDLQSAVDSALKSVPEAGIGVLPYGGICLPVVA